MCPDWSGGGRQRQAGAETGDERVTGGREDGGISGCSCYEFEAEGVFIECPNADVGTVTGAVGSLSQQWIKSLAIYNLDEEVKELPPRVFSAHSSAPLRIERLRITDSLIELVADEAFAGMAAGGLRSLAISNSRLKSVPQKSLSTLQSLESLDLDSNQIQEIGSYSFYGLPLASLNLQANRISSLFEYTFGGLENTLLELVLTHNHLDSVPLIALRRLKNLRSLKLNENEITSVPFDGVSRFPQLQTLDLRSNRILHLDQQSFRSMPVLVSLSLSSNKLTRIEDKVLSHLAELESVDLSKNSLRVLNGAVFASLHKLRSIDLSYNHLHLVEMGTFHSLPNLRELFLTRNSLIKLSNGTFYNSTQIRSLFLEHNAIDSMESGVFAPLSHLLQLHLSFNQISSIDPQVFKMNGELNSLSLDNNLIESLKPGVFDDLLELRDLRLQKNVIRKIGRGNFNFVPKLQELHLQSNAINSIEVDSFKTLTSMEYLNLQGNLIDSMVHQIFSRKRNNLKHLTLSQNGISRLNDKGLDGQTQLEILFLDHNRLKRITRNMFANLTSLGKLFLDHNEITWIEGSSFSTVKNLIHLNLANNRLNRLESETFGGMTSLETLDLSFNPLAVIEAGAFAPLSRSLRSLDLQKSEIRVIRRDFFSQPISSDTSHGPTRLQNKDEREGDGPGPVLQTLTISNSLIEKIEANALSGLLNLRTLDLSSNRLQTRSLLQSARESSSWGQKGTSDQKANRESSSASLKSSGGGSSAGDRQRWQKAGPIFPKQLVNLFLSGNNLSGLRLIPEGDRTGGRHAEVAVMAAEGDGVEAGMAQEEEEGVNIFQGLEKMELLDLSFTGVEAASFFTKGLNHEASDRQQFLHLHSLKLMGNGMQFIPSSSGPSAASFSVTSVRDSSAGASGAAGAERLKIKSQIKELFLDQNTLNSSPGPDVLKLMPQLQLLSLSGNNIKRIPSASFHLNQQIRRIDLSNNSLSVMDAGSFHGLNQSLESLDLSNNVMRSIGVGVLDGLTRLQEITFDNNWFPFIPNNLLRVKSLSSSLKRLSMNRNPMTRIREDLTATDMVLQSLERLSLEAGNVSVIASHDFAAFPGVRELSLRQNHITKISPGSFRPLTSVTMIDLSGNELQLLPEERLAGLFQLKILNLSRNHLSESPSFSPDLRSLTTLDMSLNRLTKIDSLANLGESVEELLLHDNMIAWLADNCLLNVTSLKRLDLRGNFLTHVADSLFAPIEVTLEVLLVSGNPFHCDCKLRSFRHWLEDHARILPARDRDLDLMCAKIGIANRSSCDQVPSLPGASLKQEVMFLHKMSPTTILIMGSCATSLLLTILLVAGLIVRWRARRSKRRRVKQSAVPQVQEDIMEATEIPEEYLTYRHFSLPSCEAATSTVGLGCPHQYSSVTVIASPAATTADIDGLCETDADPMHY